MCVHPLASSVCGCALYWNYIFLFPQLQYSAVKQWDQSVFNLPQRLQARSTSPSRHKHCHSVHFVLQWSVRGPRLNLHKGPTGCQCRTPSKLKNTLIRPFLGSYMNMSYFCLFGFSFHLFLVIFQLFFVCSWESFVPLALWKDSIFFALLCGHFAFFKWAHRSIQRLWPISPLTSWAPEPGCCIWISIRDVHMVACSQRQS